MAIQHVYQYTISDASVRINVSETITSSSSANLDEVVADGSTDLQLNVAVQEDDLQSWALVSTQDVTVKTNSSSTPQETISLKANRPQIWGIAGGAKPISDDVSAFFVTNSSGADATIKLIAGWDATP